MSKNTDHDHHDHQHEHDHSHGRGPDEVGHEHQLSDEEMSVEDFSLLDGADEEGDETALSDEDLELLRDVVTRSLISGDTDLLAELTGEAELDPDFADDVEEMDPHELALAEAELEVAAAAQVQKIYENLLSRAPEHDFDPKLERVQQLLDILGDPQNAYPTLQVAGTNGKSSVTRMAAALLTELGLRTGSFTSPHLVDVRERIAINGEPLSAAEFVLAWEDIAPYVGMVDQAAQQSGGPTLSYFELLTVLAFAAFADAPVDAAVFETGMGGRWDATNVVDSGVQILTPIALDHQKYLGDSLAQIAEEKAAIIKDKSIVVVMKQPEEALQVIERVAQETDSVIWLEDRDWKVLGRQVAVGGQLVDLQTPGGVYESVFVPVHGKHQAHNAGAALVAVEAILGGKPLGADVVDAAFGQVRAPGRMEVVRTSPTVIVDGAHNPAGVEAMKEALEEAFKLDVIIGVFGVMADKDIEIMLAEIEPDLEAIVLVDMPGERAADFDELVEIANDVFGDDRVHPREDLPAALDKAVELADAPIDQSLTRGVIVFGSLYLVGDTVALLQN